LTKDCKEREERGKREGERTKEQKKQKKKVKRAKRLAMHTNTKIPRKSVTNACQLIRISSEVKM